MKLKIVLVATAVGLLFLTSCRGGYSCPTYSQDTNNNEYELIKELPRELEINS